MSANDKLFAVDRIEGAGANARAIVIDDDGAQLEIAASRLGALGVEGAVLRVPHRGGSPDWSKATRDRKEEARRVRWAKKEMDRLRRGDPGGDLEL